MCHFSSLVMSDYGEHGLSDFGIDWVEELSCVRAIGTILPQSGNHLLAKTLQVILFLKQP